MGYGRRTHNKDYYTLSGRSPGPPGPLDLFKRRLSTEQARLRRNEEARLPGERREPVAKRRPGEGPLGGRPGGIAGNGGRQGEPEIRAAGPGVGTPGSVEGEAAGAPTGLERGPAGGGTALERRAAPERGAERPLGRFPQRLARTFPRTMGSLGRLAGALERPVGSILSRLQQIGAEARRS